MPRIIFDTDLGIDDALALLYLLGSAEAKIEAITTVHGNVPVEVATRNVFEVLLVAAGCEPPPVAQGSARPVAASCINAMEVHGYDGLGGWTVKGRVPAGGLVHQTATKLICDIARKYPGEVTLLLIGPASNAALALREDPDGFRLLKDIVMMSGAVFEPGNITATAEFNMYADPEAAREVIRCSVPVVLVGLDVTRKVPLRREVLEDRLGTRDDLRARFLRCIAAQGFSFYKNTSAREEFYLHDPLAAAVVLDRSLVKTRRMKVDVEISGELTRGMTVAERRPWIKEIKGGENADVCVDVDAERFIGLFCERVLCG